MAVTFRLTGMAAVSAQRKAKESKFPVPENMSCHFVWNDKWYTLRICDRACIDAEYRRLYWEEGAEYDTPTHEETLRIATDLGYEFKVIPNEHNPSCSTTHIA